MGASSDQIDREIKETRTQLDQTLGVLEQRAASSARRYARVAAGVAAGVVVVAVGAFAYRRFRRRSVARRLQRVLFESVRDLPEEVTSRLKQHLPVKIVISDKADEESTRSTWAGIAGKIAPSVAGSAAGAVIARLKRTPPEATPSE
jgi:hypothetical protein